MDSPCSAVLGLDAALYGGVRKLAGDRASFGIASFFPLCRGAGKYGFGRCGGAPAALVRGSGGCAVDIGRGLAAISSLRERFRLSALGGCRPDRAIPRADGGECLSVGVLSGIPATVFLASASAKH